MIKKIVAFAFPLMLVIAIILKFNGVDKVEFSSQYYDFMRAVIERNEVFTLKIPNIPNIPSITQVNGGWDIVKVVVDFFNMIINVVNVLILVLNTLISTLSFLLNIIIEFTSRLKSVFYPSVLA